MGNCAGEVKLLSCGIHTGAGRGSSDERAAEDRVWSRTCCDRAMGGGLDSKGNIETGEEGRV